MLRKLLSIVFRFIINLPLIFILLPLLCALEPICRIRFGIMLTQRIGHLAANTDTFIRYLRRDGVPPRTHFILCGFDPANRQLMDMWKRLRQPGVSIWESKWAVRILFAWRNILQRTRFWQSLHVTHFEFELYSTTDPVLSFTEEEHVRGQAALREMGIGKDDWFVCFHARDGKYFRQWRSEMEAHWKKTDFRSVDVNIYMDAANYIAEQGGWAIRYGAVVEEPLTEQRHPRIIDYPTHYRSDFMDIYLAAHCRFFMGSCSGPDALPTIFGRRVLSVGHFPYNHAHYHCDDLMIPRLLIDPHDGRAVPFFEAREKNYFHPLPAASAFHPTMNDYTMLDVNPEDVVFACEDMLKQLNGSTVDAETRTIQTTYASICLSAAKDSKYASKIAPSFARKYAHLIVPELQNEQTK